MRHKMLVSRFVLGAFALTAWAMAGVAQGDTGNSTRARSAHFVSDSLRGTPFEFVGYWDGRKGPPAGQAPGPSPTFQLR